MKTSWMKISLFGSSVTILLAQEPAPANRLSTVMDGNQVRTLIYNYGSIGRPNTEPSLEWPAESGQGYAFEFGLLVGTRLDGENAEPIHFIADGL
ncbi:MAG: hypothetical protein K9M19_03090, partial [Candidatus Marinimicrobia bacterium]|nr:hypothetical protein [Candidatus Neomarinimicrobiota bacterium]